MFLKAKLEMFEQVSMKWLPETGTQLAIKPGGLDQGGPMDVDVKERREER